MIFIYIDSDLDLMFTYKEYLKDSNSNAAKVFYVFTKHELDIFSISSKKMIEQPEELLELIAPYNNVKMDGKEPKHCVLYISDIKDYSPITINQFLNLFNEPYKFINCDSFMTVEPSTTIPYYCIINNRDSINSYTSIRFAMQMDRMNYEDPYMFLSNAEIPKDKNNHPYILKEILHQENKFCDEKFIMIEPQYDIICPFCNLYMTRHQLRENYKKGLYIYNGSCTHQLLENFVLDNTYAMNCLTEDGIFREYQDIEINTLINDLEGLIDPNKWYMV